MRTSDRRVSDTADVKRSLDWKAAWLPQTDLGNAERIRERFGSRLRYVVNEGWRYYERGCWRRDEGEIQVRQYAMRAARLIRKEAAALARGGEDNAALLKWARKSEAGRAIAAAISLAQVLCKASLDDFDRDPLALNVRNGTLRFKRIREGEARVTFHPHRADDMISHMAPVTYDPSASAPFWNGHLAKMLPESEVEDFVQRVFGYIATGLTCEDAIFIFQGRGGDGKTTTTKTLLGVLGSYSRTVDVQLFLAKKGQDANAASPALARLAGDVRLVSTSEPHKGARLDDGFIKTVTGGGQITARPLNKGVIEFSPRFKVLLEANAFPFVAGEDKAMWRRLHIVQWPNSLKPEEMDRQLAGKLQREGSGVLNWLVAGVLRYLEIGLQPPELVRIAGENYRAISNNFGEWMRECLIFEPDAECEQVALYRSYSDWCAANGVEPLRAQSFYAELTNQQINQIPPTEKRSPEKRRVLRTGVRLHIPERRGRTGDEDVFVQGR